ncbi:MAG: TolC family protein, partial [Limnochordia bacterium]
LLQIETQKKRGQLSFQRAQRRLLQSQRSLNQLLGRDPQSPLRVGEPVLPPWDIPQEDEQPARSLTLVQLENKLQEARWRQEERLQERGPKLALSGSLHRPQTSVGLAWDRRELTLKVGQELLTYGHGRRSSGGGRAEEWRVGFNVSLPLYDGGVGQETAYQDRLEIEALEEGLIREEERTQWALRDAYQDYLEAKASVDIATLELQTAELIKKQRVERMALGMETPLDLLNGELEVLQAENNLLRAQGEYALAIARWRRAAGKPLGEVD